ncbi:MAG: glycoside hydrolase family 2 protein [Solirubrobacteraceae bacterium]
MKPLLARILVASLALVFAATGSARAQGAVYTATPPTAGALYHDGQSGRYLLGGAWLYRADRGDVGVAQGWWRGGDATDGFAPITVPNSYNARDFSTTSMHGYVGWYRKDFTLPAGAFARNVRARDRHWIVRFESVNYRATVWLNGHQIGTHAGAFLPFEIDLTGLHGGLNRLIVRVDDRRSGSDLPPGPGGGWWNFGGILREVYLRAVQRADLKLVQVRPLLPCRSCAAAIHEQALVRNVTAAPQTVHLKGLYGTVPLDFGVRRIPPHGTWTARSSITIAHPRLWAPDHPTLYHASLTLSDLHGTVLGGYVTDSGVRSITVTSDGRLELNGRLLNLRGVNLHEQDLKLGAALDPAHLRSLVGWAKAAHAGVIRSHYPLNPEIEELADHDGILIWSEIPVYQVQSGYLAQPQVLARAHAMLRSNILTNQNHPSVLLWSIANELATPADDSETSYIAGAAALAHQLDPTRPVSMAIDDFPGVACQPAYAPLDLLGFNEYFGWFDAGGGTTDDRAALSPFLDSLRKCYPTKPLMVTEFGFEANRHGPVEERGTYEFQANAIAYHLRVMASKRWLSGAIYFALQNFAARPGWGGGDPRPDPPFVQKGLVDLLGNFTPAYPIMRSIYGSTTQIARAR